MRLYSNQLTAVLAPLLLLYLSTLCLVLAWGDGQPCLNSTLELEVIHLDPAFANDSAALQKAGSRSVKKQRSIPGVRSAQWGIQLEDPTFIIFFTEWEDIEAERQWESTAKAHWKLRFWQGKTAPATTNPPVPSISFLNVIVPIDFSAALFSHPLVEEAVPLVPLNVSLEATEANFANFRALFEPVYQDAGAPFLLEPTVEDPREFVSLVGWNSLDQIQAFGQTVLNTPDLLASFVSTFSGLAGSPAVHWQIQPVDW